LKQANAICGSYSAKAKALTKPTATSTVATVEKYIGSAVALVDQENQRLVALPQPASSGQKYSSIYSAQQSDANKLQSGATATSATQLQAAVQGLQSEGSSLDAQFNAVGLTGSGSASGAEQDGAHPRLAGAEAREGSPGATVG
jgi:hypothetical protein